METVFTECSRNIQSLNGSQKPKIFSETSQVKWETSKIVFEVARLQLHTMIHSRKKEYPGRYSFEKNSSQYEGRQQGCLTSKGGTMVKKNNS